VCSINYCNKLWFPSPCLVTIAECEIIRTHFSYLLENIKVNDLLDHLISKGVIDAHEKEHLDNLPCSKLAVVRLLLLLMKRSADYIEKFIEALRDSGQVFIADKGNVDWLRSLVVSLHFHQVVILIHREAIAILANWPLQSTLVYQ